MLCGKVKDGKVNLAAKCNGGKVIVTPTVLTLFYNIDFLLSYTASFC